MAQPIANPHNALDMPMNAQAATAAAAAALRADPAARGSSAASPCSRSTGRRRATACPRRCSKRSATRSTAIAHERTVRAVVIAANGPAFSAGHDLKELNARRSDADRGRAYFKHIMEHVQRDDAADRHAAAAGDRRGPGHRDGGRLPAGGELRSRGRLARREIRHARRQYRPVLLDADGGAVAQRPAQARDGNAAHRRA